MARPYPPGARPAHRGQAGHHAEAVRYYLGAADYRLEGPPAPLLRLLGPLTVVHTVVLFASGIVLRLGPVRWTSRLLLLHKVSFILWFVVTAVHVIGHLVETGCLAPQDWLPTSRRRIDGSGAGGRR